MLHYIEESVAVYLKLNDQGDGWVIDGPTVDGDGLYSNYENGAVNANCECDDEAACDALCKKADRMDLPTAEELLHMLADALGFKVVK